MKVAIVHDYLKEYGGAERVLEALSEIWPNAPIYTAFYVRGSSAYERFKNRDVRASWVQNIPFFATKLHSPLRFLAPLIWGSFKEEFKKYDVVVSSASWYVTKGFGRGNKGEKGDSGDGEKRPIEICYCHTPPRWLYGYKTSVEWQKYWPVKVYAVVIGHFMRMYDFRAAQRVDYFIANSCEVASRIKKFYKRDSVVIHPPVSLPKVAKVSEVPKVSQGEYYLIVSRLVGGKGIDLAIEAAQRLNVNLKIAGAPAGYSNEYQRLKKISSSKVEFLGGVSDEELVKLYSGAKAFLALSQDEDFGITPVEAMACGTPVVAFKGGGYLESVIEGKTGVFFDKPIVDSLVKAMQQLNNITINPLDCVRQAQKFSKERFKKEIKEFVDKAIL